MIEIESWAAEFAQKLREQFGERLKFLGYQGSYGRGEATETSDIDMVTVLDRAGLSDLNQYRELVRSMPQGELACGFLCGQEELAGWPLFDLLGLVLDTRPVLGSWEGLAPKTGPEDIRQALVIGASGLYHGACHAWLYERDPLAALPGLRKQAFFCLRLAWLCAAGEYVPARRDLLPRLPPAQREMMETGDGERAYRLLLEWTGDVLKTQGPALH